MPAAEEEGKTGNGNDRMSSAKNLDSFKMDDRFADGGLRRAKLASDDGYGSPGYGSMEGEIIPDSGTQGYDFTALLLRLCFISGYAAQ